MASDNQSNFEQLKQMLRECPHEIVNPGGSETDDSKLQGVAKYVYPVLETAIEHRVQMMFKDSEFNFFGEAVDELEAMRPSGKRRTSTEDIQATSFKIEDYRTIAMHQHICDLRKKLLDNNTEIKKLMIQVIKKRDHVKDINSDLEKL